MLSSIREILRAIDSTLPIPEVATADELLHGSLREPRYTTVSVGAFASRFRLEGAAARTHTV